MSSRALWTALVFAAACGPSKEATEAHRVGHAIDVLRQAPANPIDARQKLLADLEAQPAVGPLALRARDTCAKAYRLLLEGSALEARVREALADPSKVDPTVLRDLGDAEAKVKDSRAAMPECETAVSELRRKYP